MKSFNEFLKKRRIAKADADKARIEAKKRPESYWTVGSGRPNQKPISNTSSGDMWNNQTWNNQ